MSEGARPIYRRYLQEFRQLVRSGVFLNPSEVVVAFSLAYEEFLQEIEDINTRVDWGERLRGAVAEIVNEAQFEVSDITFTEEIIDTSLEIINMEFPIITSTPDKEIATGRGTLFSTPEELYEYVQGIEHLVYGIEILEGGLLKVWIITNSK